MTYKNVVTNALYAKIMSKISISDNSGCGLREMSETKMDLSGNRIKRL